jgi:predicted nucleotidyltransferase
MLRDEVVATLKMVEPALKAKGVIHAALFGSVARDEHGPDSDIDIMVEIDPGARVGIWDFVSIVHVIEDRLPRPVDVSERQALRPFVRPSAERDAIFAF